MLKNLLFSLTLAASVLSVSAQEVIKPTAQFGKSAKVEAAKKLDAKVGQLKKSVWVSPNSENLKIANRAQSTFSGVSKAGEATKKVWWSYPGDDLTALKLINSTSYNIAMYVPKSLAGAKIDSLSAMFFGKSSLTSDVTFWVSAAQTNAQGQMLLPNPGSYDKTCTLLKSDVVDPIKDGTTSYLSPSRVKLPEGYQIPENGCFVGYSFTASATTEYPLILLAGNLVDGGGYVWIESQKGWASLYEANYGNSTASILVDVTGLTSANVTPAGIQETPALVGKEASIPVSISNDGFNALSSVSYILTVDGQAQEEKTYNFATKLNASTQGFLYATYTPKEEGVKNVSINITKVDGVENTSNAPQLEGGTVLALSKSAPRVSVVEESTGAWCGWCPRGHVGLKKLKEDLGGGVITLASHVGTNQEPTQTNTVEKPDAMTTADMTTNTGDYLYFQAALTGGSAPVAIFDRAASADPYLGQGSNSTTKEYHFGATDVVNQLQASLPSEADFKLTADWADENKTSIKADVTTTFNIDRENYPYGIVYVLSEDGMKDPNPSTTAYHYTWAQTNYYAKEFADYMQTQGEPFTGADPFVDEDMASYRNGSMLVSDQVYDHVIVGAWAPSVAVSQTLSILDVLTGYTDPFSDLFMQKGQAVDYSKTLTLTSSMKKLIQDKNNLSIAALLVNTNNGMIVNAAQVSLGTGTGINGVTNNNDANAKEVARYNANGQLLKAPQKGLNIIKLSNGKSVKVMVNK